MLARRQRNQPVLEASHDMGGGWKAEIATSPEVEATTGNLISRTRIYDQLSGSHMDVEHHNEKHYLTKYVTYCSGCRRPSWSDEYGDRYIRAHIAAQADISLEHAKAEPVDVETKDGPAKRCSSCGVAYLSRPRDIYDHIRRAQAAGALHEGAEPRRMRRFSLEPPVLVEPEVTLVTEGVPAPQAEEGRRPSRRHRRHRGRHKGSAA